jgi:hypothetical protein
MSKPYGIFAFHFQCNGTGARNSGKPLCAAQFANLALFFQVFGEGKRELLFLNLWNDFVFLPCVP